MDSSAWRLRRLPGRSATRRPVSNTVCTTPAISSSGSVAATPTSGDDAPYPSRRARVVRKVHRASQPLALTSVRSAMRTPSSERSESGIVTSHSRSHSGRASSREPMPSTTVARSRKPVWIWTPTSQA